MKGNVIISALFTIAVILITGVGVAAELDIEIGKPKTECGKSALKALPTNMNTYADALRMQGSSVSRSVILSIERMQSVQQKKLVLQMKIDKLRSQLGGTADISRRNELNRQIRQLEKERGSIRVEKYTFRR